MEVATIDGVPGMAHASSSPASYLLPSAATNWLRFVVEPCPSGMGSYSMGLVAPGALLLILTAQLSTLWGRRRRKRGKKNTQ